MNNHQSAFEQTLFRWRSYFLNTKRKKNEIRRAFVFSQSCISTEMWSPFSFTKDLYLTNLLRIILTVIIKQPLPVADGIHLCPCKRRKKKNELSRLPQKKKRIKEERSFFSFKIKFVIILDFSKAKFWTKKVWNFRTRNLKIIEVGVKLLHTVENVLMASETVDYISTTRSTKKIEVTIYSDWENPIFCS